MRLAAAVDRPGDAHEAALRRIALPLAKFWVCKRTPAMVAEALECLGGNGYVEESGLPLIFRESPLNSIWEGSGNVNALDVLRALTREPEVLEAWITEVGLARGADPRLDRAVDDTLALLGDERGLEVGARRLAGQMAACLQGSLLVRFAPAEVADAFCGEPSRDVVQRHVRHADQRFAGPGRRAVHTSGLKVARRVKVCRKPRSLLAHPRGRPTSGGYVPVIHTCGG